MPSTVVSSGSADFTLGSSDNDDLTSSSYDINRKTDDIPRYIDPKVAEKEQQDVRIAKILVLLVLLLAVCGLTGTTYHLITRSEHYDFKAQVRETE